MALNATTRFSDNYELKEELGKWVLNQPNSQVFFPLLLSFVFFSLLLFPRDASVRFMVCERAHLANQREMPKMKGMFKAVFSSSA